MRCVLLVSVVIASPPTTAYAQRFVDAQVSAGAVAFHEAHIPGRWLGGWYVDAMKSLVPNTAVVGELSGFYGTEREPLGEKRWFALLGGVRQRIVQRPRVNVFAQFVLGFARYSQRLSGRAINPVPFFALQPESVWIYRSMIVGPFAFLRTPGWERAAMTRWAPGRLRLG